MILEELAFFLYRFVRWLNWGCLVILRAFRRNVTCYFLIANDGTQLPLTAYNYAVLQPTTLLVIYYTPRETKYRIVTPAVGNGTASEIVEELKSAYTTYEAPSYMFLGLNVDVHERSYAVPPQEFMVAGSTLFSPVFNLWLCKNYLHVKATTQVTATFIDDLIRVVTVSSDVVLQKDKYVLKQI
jgi:hypothetical protein